MLYSKVSSQEKRESLKKKLKKGNLLTFPGAFSPLVARQLEALGVDGIYVSGAVLSADLGLPDIGLTTLPEVARRSHEIARMVDLPSIVDIDTGFGEPMSAARTVQELEELGIAGAHLEDQINPKRCGHLDGKGLVESAQMEKKIRAAVSARRDPHFILIARTDARATEGLDSAIDRAKAYVDAGADMIFPEALQNEKEFEAFRKAVKVPLLANMTEFGKSKLLTRKVLENLGYNIVIYPVTALRLAMKTVRDSFQQILKDGSQEALVPQMQTRQELYELLDYSAYNTFDQNIFNFKLK